MMCKSKHFFRDTEYCIYIQKNSVLIGKSPQQIKYTIMLQQSTVIGWIYGHRNQFIGFKLRWKNKWKLMIMETEQCYQLKTIFDGKVSYQNLVKMFNSVKILKESSCTSIQIVYSCFDSRPYQMKVVSHSINYNYHDFQLELQVLSLQHKNMIKLKEYFIENQKFYIVYEHLNGRTLRERLNSQYKMQKKEIIVVLKQILNLLITLHQNGYICRDLMTENIVILKDGRVVLTEFGQTTKVSEILKTKRGTKDIDAELFLQQSNHEDNANSEYFEKQFWYSQDMYNLGSLFHEMLTGKSLQKTIFDKHSINYSSQNTMTSLRKKQGLLLLLDRMLEPDPKARITAEQARNFIKDMEFGDDSFEDFPDCDERSCCKEVYYFTSIVNLQNL